METPVSTTAEAVQKNTERAHHVTSPSGLQNLEACCCYQGRNSAGKAAIMGTKQHGVTETREDDSSIGDDEAAHAAECLDFYDEILEGVRARAYTTSAEALNQVQEFTEIYLPVDDCQVTIPVFDPKQETWSETTEPSTTAGYIDRAIVSGEEAYGIDWKFGKWPVESAKNNLQGICYTLGIFKKFPKARTCDFYFKQPALGVVSHHRFTREDVPKLYSRVRCVVEKAISARRSGTFDLAVPRFPVCMFCARVAHCTKLASVVLDVAKKFYPLGVPENITPTFPHDSLNDITDGIRLAGIVSTWAGAYRSLLTDRVIRKVSPLPEGYSLAVRSDREIVDQQKFKQIVLDLGGQKALDAGTSYSFGPIEEAVSEAAPRGSKKGAVENLKNTLTLSGAVVKGLPYSFLKADSAKGKKGQDEES